MLEERTAQHNMMNKISRTSALQIEHRPFLGKLKNHATPDQEPKLVWGEHSTFPNMQLQPNKQNENSGMINKATANMVRVIRFYT